MFFWLKKLIGCWLMPLPFSLTLVVAGALVWRFTHRRKLGRRLVISGAIWLCIFSNEGIGTWLVRGLETRFPAIPELTNNAPMPAPLSRCRFIVVLGGGHSYVPGWSANNQLSASALSRLVEAVRLSRRIPHARLIVSGPPDSEGGPSHSRVLADAAEALGIERTRITEISNARDTEDEAAAIRVIAGQSPVALVTSAWHLPRAMALCRRQGVDALPCPADYSARATKIKLRDFINWNVGGLERSTKAFYEWIGMGWARCRGKA